MIQSFIESIISICQIKFIEISPSLKYIDLKSKFKIKTIVKSQLIKMVDFDIKTIKINKIKINDNLNMTPIKILKYDDPIDCKIITNLYLKNIN